MEEMEKQTMVVAAGNGRGGGDSGGCLGTFVTNNLPC